MFNSKHKTTLHGLSFSFKTLKSFCVLSRNQMGGGGGVVHFYNFFLFSLREFQFMAFTSDNSSLSLNQETNQS